MTTIRPVSGWTANWMLQPPVSTPTARMIRMAVSRMCWYSRSVSVMRGGDGDRVAGVHAHRVDVLDRADDHHVVVAVAHQLELELLPADDRLLEQHLGGGAGVQAGAGDAAQVGLVVGDAGAEAAEGERGTDDDREAEPGGPPGGVPSGTGRGRRPRPGTRRCCGRSPSAGTSAPRPVTMSLNFSRSSHGLDRVDVGRR